MIIKTISNKSWEEKNKTDASNFLNKFSIGWAGSMSIKIFRSRFRKMDWHFKSLRTLQPIKLSVLLSRDVLFSGSLEEYQTSNQLTDAKDFVILIKLPLLPNNHKISTRQNIPAIYKTFAASFRKYTHLSHYEKNRHSELHHRFPQVAQQRKIIWRAGEPPETTERNAVAGHAFWTHANEGDKGDGRERAKILQGSNQIGCILRIKLSNHFFYSTSSGLTLRKVN